MLNFKFNFDILEMQIKKKVSPLFVFDFILNIPSSLRKCTMKNGWVK